jgi:hypothetical protein
MFERVIIDAFIPRTSINMEIKIDRSLLDSVMEKLRALGCIL